MYRRPGGDVSRGEKFDHRSASNAIEAQSMTPIGTTEARSVPHRRWGIAFLLGFGVLVNYFDRVNLSVSQEALHGGRFHR